MAESQAVKGVFRIEGVVQGVGFRPFVARLAREMGMVGTVQNVLGHVAVEAAGNPEAVALFADALLTRPPAGSHISRFQRHIAPWPTETPLPEGFHILESDPAAGEDHALIMPSPDLALCDDCLRELFTPGNPRYRNPFISCTHCGPRFSIMASIPYDRDATAMAPFPLCPFCEGEYRDPENRRYHAQTVCCNQCGPTLFYEGPSGRTQGTEGALSAAVAALRAGQIVAVKGIGGYHLACSPFDPEAVKRLRALKGREQKPFAVMFETLAELQTHCHVSGEEETLLLSPARPIVLLRRKPSALAAEVYTTSPNLGAFLPYTPLQHLLLWEAGPLVMTSANVSALPILTEDEEILAFLARHPALSGVLGHDRTILRRQDDSVVLAVLGKPLFLRRARGYAPLPLPLPEGGQAVLACGPQEKSTVCLAREGCAYLSPEIGDLDTQEAEGDYRDTVQGLQRLLRLHPARAAQDLHPGYFSTAYAQSLGLPLVPVQHHHAHIASVMAEHGLRGPVLGVAFDGTGYGTNGALWGGEFLLAEGTGFARVGHLKAVPFFAGDESVRQGWKSAACLLWDAGATLAATPRLALVDAALAHGVHTVPCSSMGRVFDGVSALLGVCQESGYGGQCAIELENAATRYLLRAGENANRLPLPFALTEESGPLVADLGPCLRELHALCAGDARVCREELAYRFHATVCHLIAEACARLGQKHGVRDVALSGGVFNNRLLLEGTVPLLESAGFTVYRNHLAPAGDGGVALGQAYLASLTPAL